jgi:hypothetical protein
MSVDLTFDSRSLIGIFIVSVETESLCDWPKDKERIPAKRRIDCTNLVIAALFAKKASRFIERFFNKINNNN